MAFQRGEQDAVLVAGHYGDGLGIGPGGEVLDVSFHEWARSRCLVCASAIDVRPAEESRFQVFPFTAASCPMRIVESTHQNQTGKERMKIIEIAFTGYPVTDLKRARQFYEGTLGL